MLLSSEMGEIVYKEITPYPQVSERVNSITIDAGASQSTLQDIILPETAGCFTYRESGTLAAGTSNRFIYWRTSNDYLELAEVSLDVDLRGNHLMLRFEHAPILQGLSIHELHDQVVILVPTVSTIHKLCFQHPRKLQGRDQFWKHSDSVLPSIFFDASLAKLKDNSVYYGLHHVSTGVPLPHTACSWLTAEGDAAFVLANNAGSHLLAVMDSKIRGKVITAELKRTSVMSRLWNGLIRTNQSGDEALSIVCHQDKADVFIFSLCRDLRIRMWSQSKQECLMIAPALEHYGENGNTTVFNVQQCRLKKSSSHGTNLCLLGVYISFSEKTQQAQFSIFMPTCTSDHFQLERIATFCNTGQYLVDFCLSTSQLWTLWLNAGSNPVIKMANINKNTVDDESSQHIGWFLTELQPTISRDIYTPFGESDYSEAYLKEIFHQGRFLPSTISKCINICRHSTDSSFSSSASKVGNLRTETKKAVENEILTRAGELELSEEEHQELQVGCWDVFLSNCIQYHQMDIKPLRLALDPATGYIVVIKKNMYSILCPSGPLEKLILSDIHHYNVSSLCLNPIIKDEPSLASSILVVLQCLDALKKSMSEDMITAFEHDLCKLQSPSDIGTELAKELSILPGSSDGSLIMKLQSYLQRATNLIPALKHLLKMIDVNEKENDLNMEDVDTPHLMDYSSFLSGSTGISILCEGLTQFARQRFSFCRDLLILELFIVRMGKNAGVSLENANKIHSEVIPYNQMLVQTYFVLKWCTETEFVPKQSSVLESGLRQLSILDVSENITSPKEDTNEDIIKTVVYQFLEEECRRDAYVLLSSQLSYEEFCQSKWTAFFPQLIINVAKLIWPVGPCFKFPEFLFNKAQYLQLQEYVRLLQKWCDWNSYSRLFLAANSYLLVGEYLKAMELFIEVASGAEREEFLQNKILQGIDDPAMSMTAQYYMKVIQRFENFEQSECIIHLATTVIGILNKKDPHIPIFWSLVFKHHLELGHSEEAFTALTRNPDPSRQKDCLRQLIVILCERKEYRTLIEFPYMDMQDDVISIIESRARSSDLLHQSFYDLLYAFHIHTNNFRKAATIMFEYGMRLGQEINTLEGLQKQASSYLVTLNCLNLVNPTYAWIVKPIPEVATLVNGTVNENPGLSPKRDNDGEERPNIMLSKKIEVLEVKDIRREYDLIHSRLLLVQRDNSAANMAATPLSAVDCVALLISAGLFDVAVELSTSFSLSLTPIFEGLTYRCVKSLHHARKPCLKEDEFEYFEWLSHNESSLAPVSGYVSGQEQAWYLLKYYLEQYEIKGQTAFHRCVVSKLISVGIQLPAWLKKSYQRRNCSELLYLYVTNGLLESATDLAVDYIDAVIGEDERLKNDFNIKYSLKASNPAVWLPHSYLDALLGALEDTPNEPHCTRLYHRLTEKINQYVNRVKSVSESMIMLAMNTS